MRKKRTADTKKKAGTAPCEILRDDKFPFLKLPSWKAGQIGVLIVRTLPGHFGDMDNQRRRAALSTPNNIAEGIERHPESGKNVQTLLVSARASIGETVSMLVSTWLLFADKLSKDDKKILSFGKTVLSFSKDEISRLMTSPELVARPHDIGVFPRSLNLLLDQILKEVASGRSIREVLGKMFVTKEKKVKVRAEAAPQNCFECKKPSVTGETKELTMSLLNMLEGFSFKPRQIEVFYCRSCLTNKGKPMKIVDNETMWAKDDSALNTAEARAVKLAVVH